MTRPCSLRLAVRLAVPTLLTAAMGVAVAQTFSTTTPPDSGANTVSSGSTAPPNWQLIGSVDSACAHHWDPATRSTHGAYRKAWFMDSCRDPRLVGDGTFREGRSIKVLVYANCAAGTLETMETVRYSGLYGTGAEGPSAHYELRAKDFAEPAPDSAGADELRLLCPGKPAKRR
jgi:hypothetical protein